MAAAEKLQDLVHRLSDDSSTLVRKEIELFKAELREKAQSFGKAAAFAAVAAAIAVLALFALVQAGIYGLGEALPLWASALIVTAILLLIAGVLGWLAAR